MNDYGTAKEALAKWDAGDLVWTVEMGGLGPGYEQAIQITVFEALRLILADPPDWPEIQEDRQKSRAYFDKIDNGLFDIPRINDMGLTGAQAGAAKSLASAFVFQGYSEALNSVDRDRRFMAKRDFP